MLMMIVVILEGYKECSFLIGCWLDDENEEAAITNLFALFDLCFVF